MKDTKSVLLALVSVGLVGTWVYHIVDKTNYTTRRHEIYVADSAAIAQGVRDSLQKIYTLSLNNTLNQLDLTKLQNDSLNTELKGKFSEIYKLRNEITGLLGKNNITQEDLNKARAKIVELQQMITQIKAENTDLVSEKERLTGVLTRLTEEMKNMEDNSKRLDAEKKELQATVDMGSTLIASDIHFQAFYARKEKEDLVTDQARKAEKFIISFILQNNIAKSSSAEVVVIITDPEGNVIQTNQWSAGTYATKNEGLLKYSRRFNIDYQAGKKEQIVLPLQLSRFKTGTYRLAVYHNGIKIGESGLVLK
jgi:hypothetical protein